MRPSSSSLPMARARISRSDKSEKFRIAGKSDDRGRNDQVAVETMRLARNRIGFLGPGRLCHRWRLIVLGEWVMVPDHAPGLEDVVAAQGALRAKAPLVQCLTNAVSTNFMANVLL